MDKSIGDMETMGGAPEHGGYTLSEGATLGQYRVIRALGRGGMGEVYEVEHGTLERRYALKLLPADFATHAGALDRFRREAKVTAQLQHPHIVKVDEFGETEGRYWLRMECANGAAYGDGHVLSLQDLVDAGGGRIGQETLAGILRQVLKALAHAHSQGVVHRDVKPSNILIFTDAQGSSFKIADFGLVKLVGEDWVRNQAQLTIQRSMSMGEQRTMAGPDFSAGSGTRSLLGTFEYMSPEQKRGEDATAASDMYAVGLMAYRLLTGRSLGLKTPSEIDSSLVEGWDLFVGKALEEDPGERLGSAEEALMLLESVKEQIQRAGDRRVGQGSAQKRQGMVTAPRGVVEARRHEKASTRRARGAAVKKSNPTKIVYAGAGIFLLLVVFGAALWGMMNHRRSRPQSSPASVLAARDTVDEEAGRTRQAEERHREEETRRREEEARRLQEDARNEAEAALRRAEEAQRREEEVRNEAEAALRRNPTVPAGFSVDGQDRDAASGLPMIIVHDQTGYRLRLVPAGEFMLGNPEGEGFAREQPRRRIYLDAYWIGETPITCAQYAVFLNEEDNQTLGVVSRIRTSYAVKIRYEGNRFVAHPGLGEHPVVELSWHDACNVAQWLGGDLPTEPQWEKAAKGGREVIWPWGNEWGGSMANTAERLVGDGVEFKTYEEYQARWVPHHREIIVKNRDYSDTTVPVRRYPPNGYGLYDMAGNVWEWCLDWYVGDAYAQLHDGQRNPQPPVSGDLQTVSYPRPSASNYTAEEPCRVVRGGGFNDRAYSARCAARWRGRPATNLMHFGARVVVSPTSSRGGSPPGTSQGRNAADMEFVEVKAGSFEMGSPSEGRDNERPVRTVQITRDFWIGKHEVTQREYRQVTGYDPSRFKGDNRPVETVGWIEAVQFCGELTRRERAAGRLPEGMVYRLPTEAEWEYAARGGHLARETSHAGSNDPDAVAWHHGNSGAQTHPVGTKMANELGLYDMSGNVWEWCHDWYQDSYSGLSSTNPTGPPTGRNRVIRGGCWYLLQYADTEIDKTVSYCRVAYRRDSSVSNRNSNTGFRVVLGPPR